VRLLFLVNSREKNCWFDIISHAILPPWLPILVTCPGALFFSPFQAIKVNYPEKKTALTNMGTPCATYG
jgi:hypothetical protein